MLLRLCTFALVILIPSFGWADSGQRVALVIGNAQYQNVPALDNPDNDATDIASALGRLDFEVSLVLDADYQTMQTALRDFSRAAEQADLSLVYFAGHGIEVDQVNYLIPVNAELQRGGDVAFEAVQLDLVMQSLVSAPGVKIVLVDACRNNPFAKRLQDVEGSRSIGTGLGRVDPIGGVQAGGILVGYAAREGTVALDGAGRNSPYAQALLEFIEEPGLEVSKLFRRVRDRVFQITNGAQEPFTYGALPGTDIFLSAVPETVIGNSAGLSSRIAREFAEAENTDTVLGWSEFLDEFAKHLGNPLVDLATRRHSELKALAEADERALKREPWLVPRAGLPPIGAVELNLEERKLVQRSLIYFGFDIGLVDGVFGQRTSLAISGARLKAGLTSGTHVDAALLRLLPNVLKTDALKSKKAQSYWGVDLSGELDPRLLRAINALGNREAVFDYFEGRLYVAVIAGGYEYGFAAGSNLARRMGGHLVVISGRSENNFVSEMIAAEPKFFVSDGARRVHGPMIGLTQPEGSPEPSGGWAWVTGEPFTFSNWSSGQPDNGRGSQSYAVFYGSQSSNGLSASRWDDVGAGGYHRFVIEIE